MFRAIAMAQWKTTRNFIVLASVGAFLFPVWSSHQAQIDSTTPSDFLMVLASWSVGYSLGAAAIGLVAALFAWTADHRGRHVYALSLPVTRPHYVLLRLGAGALFLVIPMMALMVGCITAVAMTHIPSGLHAYPIAMVLRFAAATLVAYTVFFAISSATARTAVVVIGLLVAIGLSQYLAGLAGAHLNIVSHTADALFSGPGVLGVFGGRWMLIDV